MDLTGCGKRSQSGDTGPLAWFAEHCKEERRAWSRILWM